MRSATPSAACSGAPLYPSSTCSACANLGTGKALTGATAATCLLASQSPCCNLPLFFLEYSSTTPLQYPYIEFNVLQQVCWRAGEGQG